MCRPDVPAPTPSRSSAAIIRRVEKRSAMAEVSIYRPRRRGKPDPCPHTTGGDSIAPTDSGTVPDSLAVAPAYDGTARSLVRIRPFVTHTLRPIRRGHPERPFGMLDRRRVIYATLATDSFGNEHRETAPRYRPETIRLETIRPGVRAYRSRNRSARRRSRCYHSGGSIRSGPKRPTNGTETAHG